jgi:hypothetical protein
MEMWREVTRQEVIAQVIVLENEVFLRGLGVLRSEQKEDSWKEGAQRTEIPGRWVHFLPGSESFKSDRLISGKKNETMCSQATLNDGQHQ